jgi:hypothetical protein
VLPWLQKEAKERQEASRAKPGEKVGSKVRAKLHTPDKGRSDQIAADLVGGTSGRQVSSAKAIKEKAPELFEEVRTGAKTIRQAGIAFSLS